MSVTDPKPLSTTFEDVFDGLAFEALQILYDRQRKYGPENIRRQGLWGIFTRIKDDKIARVQTAFNGVLRKGQLILDTIDDNPNIDETFEDALFDIANYALIMIAVKRGVWGFPMREETGEVEALAAAHPDGIPQLTAEEVREFFQAEPMDLFDRDEVQEEAGVVTDLFPGRDEDQYSRPGGISTEADLDDLKAYMDNRLNEARRRV